MIIRDVPQLHAALDVLANEFIYLSAPAEDGRPTRWVPCSTCNNIEAAPAIRRENGWALVVSLVCSDCATPCANPDCGLLVYEHIDCCELRLED